ncbi:MAG TPA: hypothetical protein VNN22_19585 [Verrucomicrobiae bacterium]|nr:hypothetical protein [Verrucomicrobiae bacterium]
MKQSLLPVLSEWFHEFIFRFGCGKGLGRAVVEFHRESRPEKFHFVHGLNKAASQSGKMPPMKNRLNTMRRGKRQDSLCVCDTPLSSEILPKWPPLEKIILRSDYAKTAFFPARMSAGNMNKP